MPSWVNLVVTAQVSIMASSGFWAYIQSRSAKSTATQRMIKGLGYDRIVSLSMQYIERGSITKDEYENLHDYLYVPYREMGGDGMAEKLMREVGRLPIHSN